MSDFIPSADSTQVDAYTAACAAESPCDASWSAAYAYAADRQFDLAVFQAFQGVVFGTLQYASADRTADLQYDIADRQMKIAEEEYCRYKTVYRACEDALAQEVCAMVVPETDYDLYANRASRDVLRQFADVRKKLGRTRNRYCFKDHMTEHCNLAKTEALALVSTRDAAYRTAEKRNDYLIELRWRKRMEMFAMGRSIQTGQSAIYDGAAGLATQALQAEQNALSSYLGRLSNSLSQVAGAYYAPQIDAPSVFGIGQNDSFNTRWGTYQNGWIGGGSLQTTAPPPRPF